MVRGRGGLTLAGRWKEGPRTLCGVHVRHFPNMFLVMGPQVREKGGERKGREEGGKGAGRGREFLCVCGVHVSSVADDVLCTL